jgi:hypothetical protein
MGFGMFAIKIKKIEIGFLIQLIRVYRNHLRLKEHSPGI